MHSKVDCKFLVSFKQIQNFEASNLAMAKIKKVNIAVTYTLSKLLVLHPSLIFFPKTRVEPLTEHHCEPLALPAYIKSEAIFLVVCDPPMN